MTQDRVLKETLARSRASPDYQLNATGRLPLLESAPGRRRRDERRSPSRMRSVPWAPSVAFTRFVPAPLSRARCRIGFAPGRGSLPAELSMHSA